MLRRETKILLVTHKTRGAGFTDRTEIITIANNAQRGAKDGFFSYRRAV